MIIFPLVAAAVSLAFTVALFRQYAAKRRIPQLAWGIAMAAFFIASLAVASGVGRGWDPTVYRVFWLFGALLNVPWLAVGSIALVSRKQIGWAALGAAVVGTAFAVVDVSRATLDAAALVTDSIPQGSAVWGKGSGQLRLVNYYSIIPYFVVVGIAIWSSRPRKGMRPGIDRIRGNIMIAAGTTVVAVGGFALRRVGRGAAFSISLAVGVAIMFIGFLLASRAPRFRVEDPGDSPT